MYDEIRALDALEERFRDEAGRNLADFLRQYDRDCDRDYSA